MPTGSHDRTLGFWDIAGRRLLDALTGHTDAVLRLAFSPDGANRLDQFGWNGSFVGSGGGVKPGA